MAFSTRRLKFHWEERNIVFKHRSALNQKNKIMALKNSLWSLQNKKTLVTGGTKGIGLSVVKEFLELGADVFVVARNTSSLIDQLKSDKLFAIEGDVTDPVFRRKIIQTINERWGKLDVLVNNVGTNVRK